MYRVKTFISGLSKPQTLGILLQRTCASVQTLSDRAQTTHSFLNGSSSVYTEHMYEAWLQDPSSVHKVIHVFKMGFGYIHSNDVKTFIILCSHSNQLSTKQALFFFFLILLLKLKEYVIKRYALRREICSTFCAIFISEMTGSC